jgi:Immunity protein Imm1
MQLSVFRQKHQVETLDQLRALLGHRHQAKYGAFWLEGGDRRGPTLAMFINDDQACMFFMREEGDPGFHSLGPEPENFKDQVDFVIDNFQLDLYPRAMVVPAPQAIAAFEEFLNSRVQPTKVRWFEL